MFFKRASKDKAVEAAPSVAAANDVTPHKSTTAPAAAEIDFKTTAELVPEAGVIGQEKALKAISFGIEMKGLGYNIFVSGPPGCGKRTAVRAILENKAATATRPPDWVYVANFDEPARPQALKFPAGRANPFVLAMAAALDELRVALPAALQSEDTLSRRRIIDEEVRSERDGALEALNQKAAAQNIAILRTPSGYALAPMHEGRVVKPEVFNQIPETMRQQVETRVESLQRELEKILLAQPQADLVGRQRHKALDEDVARLTIDAAFSDVKAAYADLPEVSRHLAAAAVDLVLHGALLVAAEQSGEATMRLPIALVGTSPFQRFLPNAIVAGAEGQTGAPVIEEPTPAAANITGIATGRNVQSLRPGALHRANGGFLILDAHDLRSSPAAWSVLKRALNAGHIAVGRPETSSSPVHPQPIPLDIKVILVGSKEIYDEKSRQEPDFKQLFQVHAEFTDRIAGTAETRLAMAQLIASIVKRHGLRQVDAAGVAGLIDEAARMTDTPDYLSLDIARIADLVREADHWADKAGRVIVTPEDVNRAIAERNDRAGSSPS